MKDEKTVSLAKIPGLPGVRKDDPGMVALPAPWLAGFFDQLMRLELENKSLMFRLMKAEQAVNDTKEEWRPV